MERGTFDDFPFFTVCLYTCVCVCVNLAQIISGPAMFCRFSVTKFHSLCRLQKFTPIPERNRKSCPREGIRSTDGRNAKYKPNSNKNGSPRRTFFPLVFYFIFFPPSVCVFLRENLLRPTSEKIKY